MIQIPGVIICLGYILGLMLAALPWGGWWTLVLGIGCAVVFQRLRLMRRKSKPGAEEKTKTTSQTIPHPRFFLIAGLVGLLASFYVQWRIPHPQANDISNFVPPGNNSNQEQLFVVRGTVESTARVTRSQRGQFWLEASQLLDDVKKEEGNDAGSKAATGKVYVTVPLLQATGLRPGQQISVTGVLYKPKAAANPGSFDFQEFLKKEGAFAGLSGRQVNILQEDKKWGWWKLREQIMRSHVRSLDIPEGPLVSAMVLGSKAVDMPYDVRDMFVQAGLAHALAASGFQTSLILGVILSLTRRAKRSTQLIVGSIALLGFLGLTGFQPAVLRAVIMGFAALIALVLRRKVVQLGSLILAATLLLLFNPLWIWDLGFQLSFLATLGLIVTVPAITRRLGWMPPAIASLIAVPLAATIWTLPLQIYSFGVVPTYSLLLNIVTTPLISVISIGGFLSAIAALIVPDAGSAIAGILHYPVQWLLQLVHLFAKSPGNSLAVGTISTIQMVVIYTLFVLVWLVDWWRRRWLLAGAIAITLILIPILHSANTLFRVTMLAASGEPVIVIQDQNKVTVVNSGDEGIGRFTILPFLQQQGVNQIDLAVASDFQGDGDNGWLELLPRLPIKAMYDYSSKPENALTSIAIQKEVQKRQGIYQPLAVGQTINAGSVVMQLVNDQLPILQMQVQGKTWLFIGNLKAGEIQQLVKAGTLPKPQVLWCQPQTLKELVPLLQPEVSITTNADLDAQALSELSQVKTKLFFTGRDGAIQWTPKGQFEAFIQANENKSSVL
ncbi:ComEC/Rec2 family competence protein [Calothrix sp. PCC 6303]|uniref:ComEC/Rec2 family competence protein n=1 Tax=Calothrix sp. PCC 6303 TaxID=1170562 RepID=UPI0002A022AF|nr:ComEC/Rec2 family competence protein [Calothrix sp. PCC 6303]AFZ02316.1 ComEC/Rec2-related protein [Calothrix sp. PCC 6303]